MIVTNNSWTCPPSEGCGALTLQAAVAAQRAAGIFTGGFHAAKTTRHDRVAATGLAVAASLLAIVATTGIVLPLVLPLFAVVGFVLGATGPSRDLIVRNATPRGAAGRVYGFVYSGLDLGATVGPIWFGLLLDHGPHLFLQGRGFRALGVRGFPRSRQGTRRSARIFDLVRSTTSIATRSQPSLPPMAHR